MPTPTRAEHRPEAAAADGPRGFPFDGFGPEEFEFPTAEDAAEEEAGARGAWAALERWGSRIGPRLAWLGLAALLSLGSAGIVAGTSQPPSAGGRPELTYGSDRELSARLDAAIRELALLGGDVNLLGDQARSLLSYVTQVNEPGLTTTYATAAAALMSIGRRAADLDSRLDCDPWSVARTAELDLTYSAGLVDRWHQVCAAIDSIAPLDGNWQAMVAGSKVAMSVADAIGQHDTLAGQALQLATQGRYPDALAKLAQGDQALVVARQVATKLASTGQDVSTLTQWLDRIDGMDVALDTLWQAMIDSNGRVNAAVTAALRTVGDAKALLPETNAVLSIVLYELAGNLISEGIAVEQAKGQLSTALAALTEIPAAP